MYIFPVRLIHTFARSVPQIKIIVRNSFRWDNFFSEMSSIEKRNYFGLLNSCGFNDNSNHFG